MSEIQNFAPRGIKSFVIVVFAYDDAEADITDNVVSVDLYESIFAPFIHGEMVINDNSALASVLPFFGQERIVFRWEKNGETFEREFRTIGIENLVRGENDSYGNYKVLFTSEIQLLNATNPFSKSYLAEPSHEIIEQIYTQFLGPQIKMDATGKTVHNIVFPYIKPLQAIDTILKNTLADDNTPMFLFDRFYEENEPVILTSYGKMMEQSSITEILPMNSTNVFEKEGEIERGQAYEWQLQKGFKTLDHITRGSYHSTRRTYDLSNKTQTTEDFYFKDSAPPLGNDWISDDFSFDRETSQWVMSMRNEKAFDNGFPNLYGTEPMDNVILGSYLNRISTSTLLVHMSSLAYTVQTGDAFTVGKTVDYVVPVFMPKGTSKKHENLKNKLLSGKYLISAIRHHIVGDDYTMSVELIRDFMGEEASI